MTTPTDANKIALLRSLKGAPISVVFAMLLLPGQGVGANDLATMTGYSKPSILRGLDVLASFGLAQRHGRYKGWALTLYCRQLILGETDNALPDGEVKKLYLGSSSGYDLESSSPDHETTTTTQGEVKTFDLALPGSAPRVELSERWRAVVHLLRSSCGTPEDRACEAVEVAVKREFLPGFIKKIVLLWLMYCASDAGATIGNVGYFIAARVEDGVKPPDTFRADRNSAYYEPFQQAHRQHIAEEVAREVDDEAEAGENEAPQGRLPF